MAEQKRDYYEVLGISKTADDAEIKKAYRVLAKKYHPDMNPGDAEAEKKFKEASEAYAVLSDPEKRRQYDQFGHAAFEGGGAGGFGGFDFNLSLIHILVFIALIVIIAGVSAFRLYRWNKGSRNPEADIEQVDPSEFDTETMDMILPMDGSLLEGHEDDGELTILCLGNNPFSDERGENGLAAKIAEKTNATVYNCAFPDSSVACKYAEYNPSYTRDHFNLYYVVTFLEQNQFTAIESIAKDEPDPRYLEAVEELKTVDMSKVDVLLVM